MHPEFSRGWVELRKECCPCISICTVSWSRPKKPLVPRTCIRAHANTTCLNLCCMNRKIVIAVIVGIKTCNANTTHEGTMSDHENSLLHAKTVLSLSHHGVRCFGKACMGSHNSSCAVYHIAQSVLSIQGNSMFLSELEQRETGNQSW